jgi:PAS domain S-box-containing protein
VKESEEKYRLLTESANIGIISFTREGKIFQFNRKAEELFGFSREEIINDSVLTLLPATHHELIERIAKQYMSSGTHKPLVQPLVDYVKRRDGSPLVLEIAYSVWGERINPLITATIRDVR